jgi:hypothetical protein
MCTRWMGDDVSLDALRITLGPCLLGFQFPLKLLLQFEFRFQSLDFARNLRSAVCSRRACLDLRLHV